MCFCCQESCKCQQCFKSKERIDEKLANGNQKEKNHYFYQIHKKPKVELLIRKISIVKKRQIKKLKQKFVFYDFFYNHIYILNMKNKIPY